MSAFIPPRMGSLEEARKSLDLIEGALKAYASKAWWEEHGFDLVDNVRRGLTTREMQEGFGEDWKDGGPVGELEEAPEVEEECVCGNATQFRLTISVTACNRIYKRCLICNRGWYPPMTPALERELVRLPHPRRFNTETCLDCGRKQEAD